MKLVCVAPRLLTEENILKEFVNSRYFKPLNERGFNTIMISKNNPNNEKIFEVCDAFLLTGGYDIDPTYFNETNDEGLSKNVNVDLDELDKDIILHSLKTKKPLLGICRGHQALNIFLGGTLYQDLGDKNKDHVSIKENHIVKFKENNKFNLKDDFYVNSYHHQAVKDIAPDLVEIGYSLDGTNEMLAHKTLPMFSVQWHPEIKPDSKESKIIFDIFEKYINGSDIND